MSETGDARAEVEQAKDERLETLRALRQIASGAAESPLQVAELGLDEFAEPQVLADEAKDALNVLPLAVERTVQFEVVLGVGGPDDRFIVECRHDGLGAHLSAGYEVHRVLYRYSWTGSAEVELVGDERELALEFARQVVPGVTV